MLPDTKVSSMSKISLQLRFNARSHINTTACSVYVMKALMIYEVVLID